MVRPMLAWWMVAGCGPGFNEEDLAGTRHVYTRVTSSVNGTATLKLPIHNDEAAMLATVQVEPPNSVHVRSLLDPSDVPVFEAFAWNDSPYSKTNAGFVADVVSLNWPVQQDDPLLSGGKWLFEFGVVDQNKNYIAAPVRFDVLIKEDPEFDRGALDVSIVFSDGLENDDNLRFAVEEAKLLWVDLYAKMGIDMGFATYAYDDTDLEPPAFGNEPAYVNIAQDTEPRSLNLVISDQIEGYADIFGIAGDIPGPLVPTTRSAVQVSALLAAGPDGLFSPEETRLLAETMAHEAGHYIGLFHPVESTWDAWDVLPDTPECDAEDDCVDKLGTNLMFPYPVCGPTTCTPQDELTNEQASVTNRNVAVW